MKIQQIGQNPKPNFGAKMEITRSAEDCGFYNELSPIRLSKKMVAKLDDAFQAIESKLPEETIVFDYVKTDSVIFGADSYIVRVKSTGMELARGSQGYPFVNWPNLIVKTGKEFIEKYVPLVESMKNVVKK